VASKKDLTEAQSFSRRRLLTAFTSGAVGTTELEPAKPLRAVVAGMALTALVVLGGVFYGLISPGLPTGWENNRLVLAKDTGARYVSSQGTLYPVVNTASARLSSRRATSTSSRRPRASWRPRPSARASASSAHPTSCPPPVTWSTPGGPRAWTTTGRPT